MVQWSLKRWRCLSVLLIALTCALLYLSLFIWPSTPRLLQGDQFINFDNARRMVEGESLYGDIFQYTLPGTELLEVPLIKTFGAKLSLLNALIIIVGVADVLLALNIASRFLQPTDAVLAALLFLCFGFHCSLDATHHLFSIMMAYAALAVVLPSRSPRQLFGGGVLLGLATCFTQTRGLVALALAGFVAWENGRKPSADQNLGRDEVSLLLPFAVIVAMACVYVLWKGGFDHFYRNIIRFPFLHYRAGNANSWVSSFNDWFPTLRGVIEWALIKLLVPGVCLVFWIYWWSTRDEPASDRASARAVLLAVFGTSMVATVIYAPLHVRLAALSLPSIVLAFWMLNRWKVTFWRTPTWLVVFAFMVFAPIAIQTLDYKFYEGRTERLATSDEDLFFELTWLDHHTSPGEKFFCASGPMLYVLLDLQNPARVPFVESDDYTRPYQVEFTALRLHQARPRFILWPYEPNETADPGDRLYLLGKELLDNYRPVVTLRDGVVWERKR